MILSNHLVLNDIAAAAIYYAICRLAFEFVFKKLPAKWLLDLHLRRKLFHITFGVVPMLCWPMFSSGPLGPILAGVIPGVYSVTRFMRMREDSLKTLADRYPNYSDIVKAILGYFIGMSFATIFYWRTPTAVAVISNLCAGDGMADIVGRRYGSWKLPYNRNKSFAGSLAMLMAGFFVSIGYMYYFSWLGFVKESPKHMFSRLFVVSLVSTLVESHPLSAKFDDNFTVPVAAILVGHFVF